MVVQMTRAEYEEKYGTPPSVPAKPAPVRMTRAEYQAKYGQTPEGGSIDNGVAPTFKASIGGAGTIIPNVAKTIGNIPSSAANILDFSIVEPARKIQKSEQLLGEIYDNQDYQGNRVQSNWQSTKDIASGFVDTGKKIFKAPGEFLVGTGDKKDLERNLTPIQERALKEREDILRRLQEARQAGRDTTALSKALKYNQEQLGFLAEQIGTPERRSLKSMDSLTNVIKYPIERPLDIPATLYGGTKATTGTDIITDLTKPITRGADTSFSGIAKNLTTKSEQQIESAILKKYEKGVKPLLPSKTTPAKLQNYREDVISAVKTIKENKPNLSYNTSTGEVITGRNPASLQELSDAVEQTKKTIFQKYDSLAKEAGDAGVGVNMSPIASELDAVIGNKALSITNPRAIQYAKETQKRLLETGKLDAATAQEVVQNYNKSLEAFYRNPSYDNASQAAIDAMLANRVRQALDEGITGLTGTQYGTLKRQYGSLKAIERDVIKATLRDARKSTKGLIDFTDIFSGGQVVSGILTLNPATITQGLAAKAIAEFYKYLNNPNKAIEKMFKIADTPFFLPQRTNKNVQIPTKTNPPNATAPIQINALNKKATGESDVNLPIISNKQQRPTKRNIPINKSSEKFNKNLNLTTLLQNKSKVKGKTISLLDKLKNTPNKQGGFIQAYKGEKDLTTKILKDLEGKTTVSKQYILDATNRGELKQVERDLVRNMLDGEKDVVNVKDFAKKVKAELLPLKPTKQVNPRYENVSLPSELRGSVKNYSENVYESPIKTSAGDVHFSSYSSNSRRAGTDEAKNYFGHTRIEDMADNKTRRVIEVQSDLYQKGNLEREVPNKTRFVPDPKGGGNIELPYPAKELERIKARESEVAKLQQYNDPTAHFRMVREEIKKAAEDGKTKLQFPTGETAMKIEGLGQAENNWQFRDPVDNFMNALDARNLEKGLKVEDGAGLEWIITDVLGDGKFKAVQKRHYDNVLSDIVKKNFKNLTPNEKSALESATEQFDISGKVDTNNPIYKFYEKEVQKYLNKFGGKRVVDDKGVSWIEVPITKEQGKQAVEAFGKTALSPLFIGAGAGVVAAGASQYYKKKDIPLLPKKK